ncbi:hypothetical protein GF323_00725 [Candidatus Woesearchaeota archaeon]|nr:hypothetical protein [Candidatus Woesearchaeota archaeon]
MPGIQYGTTTNLEMNHYRRELNNNFETVDRLELNIGMDFSRKRTRGYVLQATITRASQGLYLQFHNSLQNAARDKFQVPQLNDLQNSYQALCRARELLEGSKEPYELLDKYVKEIRRFVNEHGELSDILEHPVYKKTA